MTIRTDVWKKRTKTVLIWNLARIETLQLLSTPCESLASTLVEMRGKYNLCGYQLLLATFLSSHVFPCFLFWITFVITIRVILFSLLNSLFFLEIILFSYLFFIWTNSSNLFFPFSPFSFILSTLHIIARKQKEINLFFFSLQNESQIYFLCYFYQHCFYFSSSSLIPLY